MIEPSPTHQNIYGTENSFQQQQYQQKNPQLIESYHISPGEYRQSPQQQQLTQQTNKKYVVSPQNPNFLQYTKDVYKHRK